MRRGLARLLGVPVAASLACCASACTLAYEAPRITVAEVRLASLGLSAGSLLVGVEVENPNRYTLESRDFRYVLAFAEGGGHDAVWTTLAEGRVEQAVRVPGRSTAPVQVTVPFETASVGSALLRLLRQGELEYRFNGELLAGTPLGAKRIVFDQRGLFRP
ncbi:MAG: LEA type 2 family protein [Gemmatimonadetes bacterium]|nr:LEA type 2 family protein [Gemmatimonadota bacterium]